MAQAFCPHCMTDLPPGATVCPKCGKGFQTEGRGAELPPGTVLQNGSHSFVLGAVKGAGGFGMTYIGKELRSGRVVAVKEYYPTQLNPYRMPGGMITVVNRQAFEGGRRSFLREATMLRAVGSLPGIVHVLDYFEANGTAYMVMEYLDGVTLQNMLKSGRRMTMDELLGKMLPLMEDIGKLHEAGVIHRDIAPDNIMWMPDGSLKLLDFGCARSMEDGKSMTVHLKQGFAPVEQYQTRGQGTYTDVYALCATIYYCITGKVPPYSPERLEIYSPKDPLVPPSVLGAKIRPEHEQALLQGMAVKAQDRIQTMGELIAKLGGRVSAPAQPRPVAPQTAVQQPRQPVRQAQQTPPVQPPVPYYKPGFDWGAFLENYKYYLLAGGIALVVLLIIFFGS